MTCYRPHKAVQGYYQDDDYMPDGWAQPRIWKPEETAVDGVRSWSSEPPDKVRAYQKQFLWTRELVLPCGHCVGCRLDNARMWSMRMMHEARYSKHTYFVTLTYADENLPPDADLRYSDLRDFFKRARHHYQGEPAPTSRRPNARQVTLEAPAFRYFACGEYGDRTLRPHYHFAAFDFKIDDLRPFKQTASGWYFISESLRQVWRHGHVIVAPLEWSSASYISRYVTKKMRGQDIRIKRLAANEDEEAEYYTVQRAFQSKGLGLRWYEDNKQEVWDLDACLFRGQYLVKVPRYYYKKLKECDPDWAQEVESARWHKYADKREPLDTTRDRQLLYEMQAKNLELQTLKRSL